MDIVYYLLNTNEMDIMYYMIIVQISAIPFQFWMTPWSQQGNRLNLVLY